MKKKLTIRDADILVTYLCGSASYVFPSLRLVSVTLETNPEIYFYVHGQPSDDDKESMNLIHTYFGVGFSSHIDQGSYDIIRIDAPNPIKNFPGECVYARKEQKLLIPFKSKIQVEPQIDQQSKIFLTMQRAIINNIFPELRSIHTTWNGNTVCLIAIIDKELSEDNKKSLECIRNDFVMLFPEKITCTLKIIRIDLPTRITEDYGPLIYLRKEFLEDDPEQPYDIYQN